MRYLIIGLGIYGSNLARDLTDLGHEVICADHDKANVDAIKDYVSTTYIIDSCDPASLAALPLKNVDLVIVAIGENFGASIKTVALLRQMGVRKIYARAVDELHQAILEGLDVTRIVTPEQRAARDLVNEMELDSHVESLRVDADSYVATFTVPDTLVGVAVPELSDELKGLRLISVSRPKEKTNILGIAAKDLTTLDIDGNDKDARIAGGDHITVYGTHRQFKAFFRSLGN